MESDAEIRADVRECVAACQHHHQKRVCTKTVWSVPCVPQNTRMQRGVLVHGAQPHTVQEIKGDTKRGKRVMTYSEMCESRTNKRRTLTERVFEQQTACHDYPFGDPRHPHVRLFIFSLNFRHPTDRDRRRSSEPESLPSSYCSLLLDTQGDDSMMHAVTACLPVKNACQRATIQACFRRAAGA